MGWGVCGEGGEVVQSSQPAVSELTEFDSHREFNISQVPLLLELYCISKVSSPTYINVRGIKFGKSKVKVISVEGDRCILLKVIKGDFNLIKKIFFT